MKTSVNIHIENKKMALLVTAADKAGEGNTDLIEETFERLTRFTKSSFIARLIVPFCTTPDALGIDQRAEALSFVEKIVS